MLERIGETLLINGEFLNREELELMPQLANYLMNREKAKNVVIYGIKDNHLYILSKCKETKIAEKIMRKFSKAGESKKVGDLILAKIPLGIIATVENRFKRMQYIQEIMTEIIEKRRNRKKFENRLNEIKKLIVA